MSSSDSIRPYRSARRRGHCRPAALFLCVHNAGRSQMALGWFTHLAGDRAVPWFGGSEPIARLDPAKVETMAEAAGHSAGFLEAVNRGVRSRPK